MPKLFSAQRNAPHVVKPRKNLWPPTPSLDIITGHPARHATVTKRKIGGQRRLTRMRRIRRAQSSGVTRGGGSGNPFRPDHLVYASLPSTVGQVKQEGAPHTAFDVRGMPDDFAFGLWCLIVPEPLVTPTPVGAMSVDPSQFLTHNHTAIGDALPDDILLLVRVTGAGDVDRGFASTVATALELPDDEFPVLLFFREPVIRIRRRYRNAQTIEFKDDSLNGFAISLGGCDLTAVQDIVRGLPEVLKHDRLPIDRLTTLVEDARQKAVTRHHMEAAKRYGLPVIRVLGATSMLVLRIWERISL